MYEPGLRTGVSESSGGLAIISVIASTGYLPADTVKRDRNSQKTTVMLRVYSSYIRKLFEENFEQLHNLRFPGEKPKLSVRVSGGCIK